MRNLGGACILTKKIFLQINKSKSFEKGRRSDSFYLTYFLCSTWCGSDGSVARKRNVFFRRFMDVEKADMEFDC